MTPWDNLIRTFLLHHKSFKIPLWPLDCSVLIFVHCCWVVWLVVAVGNSDIDIVMLWRGSCGSLEKCFRTSVQYYLLSLITGSEIELIMAPTRKNSEGLLARVNFPLYALQMLTNRHVLVAGGGGSSKSGVANGFVSSMLNRSSLIKLILMF